MSKLRAKELVEVLTTMVESGDRDRAELAMRRKVREQTQLAFIEPIFMIAPLEVLRNYVSDIEGVLIRAESGQRQLWEDDSRNELVRKLSGEGELMSLLDGRVSHHQDVMATLFVASIESLAESIRTA